MTAIIYLQLFFLIKRRGVEDPYGNHVSYFEICGPRTKDREL